MFNVLPSTPALAYWFLEILVIAALLGWLGGRKWVWTFVGSVPLLGILVLIVGAHVRDLRYLAFGPPLIWLYVAILVFGIRRRG